MVTYISARLRPWNRTEDGLGTEAPHMLITVESYESFYGSRAFCEKGFSMVKGMESVTLKIFIDNFKNLEHSTLKTHATASNFLTFNPLQPHVTLK